MKVKQLIAQLKTMPQTAEVYFRDHDRAEHETSASIDTVRHIEKNDFDDDQYVQTIIIGSDKDTFDGKPKQWVVLGS